MKRGYSLTQIGLHWLIAVLVPIQYLTGGSIERTHHAVHMGMAPVAWDIVQHHIHNYAGIAVGLLMGARLTLRLMRPPVQVGTETAADKIARLLHHGFYVAILAQAAMGVIASYVWFGIAPIHVIGSRIILAMVALHLFAATWHTFVVRDDTVDRMIFPRPNPSAENLPGN
ncbi:cytochrome b [Rhizobium phaseoli]|uniref:cytochrome b n=1 Tax=Rhizobium phaseoli TaxID=396 RepID=UPI00255554CF|nr:cytochrome b/b6 domain-containing protein [Rhizobium phaseoli]MDK4724953.1 cytochrome b/b6 domain-containing protein [Rhizobium phaseoli]